MIEDLWYKNAIVYSMDVETFMDGNGDGVGDFRGLRERLDYLAGLGVTCLWLLPFYPTPNRDNGYDVSDYYGVDARLGDLGDFVSFSHQARMHGIRIIVDLVVNHTSDQHPWFQAARRDPKSRFRDYYVWASEPPDNAEEGLVFPGTQSSTWTYDEQAGAYYYHRFYSFQPDLNIANPAVREEVLKIMGFWLELGVSGFRVDAVPFLFERQGTGSGAQQGSHDFIAEMRNMLSWRRGDAILLAEANVSMDEIQRYLAKGERMQLAFNFVVNQALFLALADERNAPLAEALGKTLHLAPAAQWANFLRNHDELDLARLSDDERERVFSRFAPEPDMQLYGRGVRRRLAPMLDNDARRLELAYSLLLTLPGTPVFWYGEEIGMGERLSLPGRQSVRTPMQWSSDRHGGFSRADEIVKPMVDEGAYGYQHVNVVAQKHDPHSLSNQITHMVRTRRECAEIGFGAWDLIETSDERVLGLRYLWKGNVVLALHNFAASEVTLSLTLQGVDSLPLVNILNGTFSSPDEAGCHHLQLGAYGYLWLRAGSHYSIAVGELGVADPA